MIAVLREWITAIVVIHLLLAAVQVMIPDGAVRQAASFISGLLFLAVFLQPILKIDMNLKEWDFSVYENSVLAAQETLREAEQVEMAELIESKTAAYISDKANALGQPLQVRVKTEVDEEGIPVPSLVELEGPFLPELSDWLAQEIGLGAERQVWNGGKN